MDVSINSCTLSHLQHQINPRTGNLQHTHAPLAPFPPTLLPRASHALHSPPLPPPTTLNLLPLPLPPPIRAVLNPLPLPFPNPTAPHRRPPALALHPRSSTPIPPSAPPPAPLGARSPQRSRPPPFRLLLDRARSRRRPRLAGAHGVGAHELVARAKRPRLARDAPLIHRARRRRIQSRLVARMGALPRRLLALRLARPTEVENAVEARK